MPEDIQTQGEKDYSPRTGPPASREGLASRPTTSSRSQSERAPIKTQFINPWKVFFWEAVLFSLALGLGIFAALKLNLFFEETGVEMAPISFWKFIFYFALITLFFLALSQLKKVNKQKGIIFRIFFIFGVFFGGVIVLGALVEDILALILISVLIFWWLRKPQVLIHNILIIFALAGGGAMLGLRLTPQIVVAILIVFSIYDFIAVYKTKHMLKMAKEMIETGVILGLIVPQKVSGFFENLKEVKPGGKFLILGGGDVVFPLLLCASLIPAGVLNSLIVALFALAGLLGSFWIFTSQKIRAPIPALPPIALFSIIGFLVTLLV